MQSKLDVQKAEVLAKAVAAGTHGHDKSIDPARLRTFLERYYRHVAAEDVAEREPTDCLGAAKHHYKSAMSRPQGTAKVHVFTPTPEDHGWSANGRTVVEIVVDDMPFLVDSAAMVINEHNLELQLLVHPQFVVRRDVAGTLQEVLDDTATSDEHDLVRESWMHLEIERISDIDEQRALEQELQRVLHDVRVAVEDWPKMHEQAVTIADGLDASELPVERARGRGGPRAARVARRRALHLPRLPRVRLHHGGRAGHPPRPAGLRPGHPPGRPEAELGQAAARGEREGAGAQAAHPDQGELALHRAPVGVPGLCRHQAVRRERRAGRGVAGSSVCCRRRRTPRASCRCRCCGARRWSCSG